VNFALRVGVNTGEVLAGAIGAGYTVVGDTVNIAARLQDAARPGTVTVGARTAEATVGAVEYGQPTALKLKGKSDPVLACEALSVIAPHALGRARRPREARFVGRAQEIDTLESIFERVVREGRPHLVTLIGEAGVGKTRLLGEFQRRLSAHERRPSARVGRCLPYGAGIVYWALGEIIRAESGIVDADSSQEAWRKLHAYVTNLPGMQRAGSELKAASIGTSLGLEVPTDLSPEAPDDPERARAAFFAALRSTVQARAQRGPLLIAFEDIHWADDGMLDAIEHLAQWVRAPLMLLCLTRDELLKRRAGWGGGRRNATQLVLEPLAQEEMRDLVGTLLPASKEAPSDIASTVAERSGGNPLFAEEMARRILEQGEIGPDDLPESVQAVLTARLDALQPLERRLVQHAAVVGQTFPVSALVALAHEEGGDLESALMTLQEREILAVVNEDAGGEVELAFKHVLIRDVAYGMLPKAVRSRQHFEVGRFLEERAGDRTDEVVPLLAEHYGRAATAGSESGVAAEELTVIRERATRFLEEAGDAAARLYSNREAASHYRHALDLSRDAEPAVAVRIGEKLGDISVLLGRVDAAIDVLRRCLEYHRGHEDLERVADLHRKLGAALSHKGDRKAAIEHYQKGINLLKDGPPLLELVRLYEEAAWLYLNTGDNMLAIYASEKALRLADRMGETRAASRAHGIFGRVFGRIGDTEKARSNLERAVELARGSDQTETILSLLALGRHFEISEGDVDRARVAYQEALEIAERIGDLPSQIELYASLGQLAAYRAEWAAVAASTEASANLAEEEGMVGKLCLPYALRGLLRWREGDTDGAAELFRRAHELAEQVGWSEVAFQALYGLALALRDSGDLSGAVAALAQAGDVCERAGLIAQSVQATATRAVVLSLAGRRDAGRQEAEEAGELAERLPYPIGHAAAREALGATASDPSEGARLLAEAEEAWAKLDRPLEAVRCRLLAGQVLADVDPVRSRELLTTAADTTGRLGVPHLAARGRALAG
jgi:adenylate cyclase